MAGSNDTREQLLHFINQKAFDPILNASPGSYEDKDREMLKEVQRKTKNEKAQFESDYTSAEKVKDGFLSDVRSEAAKSINNDLEHLKLPTLPSLKEDFMALCRKLGV